MRNLIIVLCLLCFVGCKQKESELTTSKAKAESIEDSSLVDEISENLLPDEVVILNEKQANELLKMPLKCVDQEYPNKLSQTLGSESDLKTPKALHPSFYGCFDWHSSVHGHWSMVSLLKQYPQIKNSSTARAWLKTNLTKQNIKEEVAYFNKPINKTYERTYGWAWLLKLSEELYTWEDSIAPVLHQNLEPLTQKIVQNYKDYLPNLSYPIRVGEHQNTAFGLSLAYDYAQTLKDEALQKLIETKAKAFYLNDNTCPLAYEPSGHDFFSPCLMEVNLMQKVLEKETFKLWLKEFMPELLDKSFSLEPVSVTDRTDGKLVHLDGLNFSRASVLFELANAYEEFEYLKPIAEKHLSASFDNIAGDSYEGGHWLATFALYAINQREQ